MVRVEVGVGESLTPTPVALVLRARLTVTQWACSLLCGVWARADESVVLRSVCRRDGRARCVDVLRGKPSLLVVKVRAKLRSMRCRL